jgi:phage virion morphogenesis protein
MAGTGIDVEFNEQEIKTIIGVLQRASAPKMQKLAQFAGEELQSISKIAFEQEKDPATGKKWKDIKPRKKQARSPGSTHPILTDYGQLRRSLVYDAFPDGSVLFGSPMVYSRVHQEGGRAGRNHSTKIEQRPFLGVPKDFDRKILSDPAILKLLGVKI